MRHPKVVQGLALANVILCGILAEPWWLGVAWGTVALLLLDAAIGRRDQAEQAYFCFVGCTDDPVGRRLPRRPAGPL